MVGEEFEEDFAASVVFHAKIGISLLAAPNLTLTNVGGHGSPVSVGLSPLAAFTPPPYCSRAVPFFWLLLLLWCVC
jgi:hypothetical protein